MTHEDAIRTLAPERYLLDEMSDQEREAFEAHYFSCSACAEDLRMANLIREEMRSDVPAGVTPASAHAAPAATVIRPARWSRRIGQSVVVPWAVAASLALVVGYQSVATDATLRQALAPQALSPVVLRGATRGAAPVVSLTDGQSLVALSLDAIVEPATQQLSFDLLGPSENALLSGRASVPPSGVPLLLLVPSDRLAGPGRHTLVVRDADRPETLVGEYAFVVSQ